MSTNNSLTFCIVAGEVSGDQLGAGLISALKQLFPQAQFVGIGGDLMRKQGCQTWYDIADLSYFGVVDVVKNLPSILNTIKQTKELVAKNNCTIYIGIDNPDFNLRVAKYCKQTLNIPTVQYVSPSVWAWRQGRVKTIKAAIDQVLCLLPFEPTFYQAHDLPASYVGHRLANSLKQLLTLDLLPYLQLAQIRTNPTIPNNNPNSSLDSSSNSSSSSNPNSNYNSNISPNLNYTSHSDCNINSLLSEQDLKTLSQDLTKQILELVNNPNTDNKANSEDNNKVDSSILIPKFNLEQVFSLCKQELKNHSDKLNLTLAKLEQTLTNCQEDLLKDCPNPQDLWQGIFNSDSDRSSSSSNYKSKSSSNSESNSNSNLKTNNANQHNYFAFSEQDSEKLPSLVEFGKQLITRNLALASLGLDTQDFYVAVLPGSRSSEIELILEPFLAGIDQALKQKLLPSNTHLLIPIAKPKLLPLIKQITSKFKQLQITLVDKNAHQVLLASNLALVASGTATLDTLLCHIPMIVGYKLSSFNYFLAKRLVKLPYVALSNIVQGQEVSKELIQEDLVPAQICKYLEQLLKPYSYYSTRLHFFKQHLALVSDSDNLAAHEIAKLLKERNPYKLKCLNQTQDILKNFKM